MNLAKQISARIASSTLKVLRYPCLYDAWPKIQACHKKVGQVDKLGFAAKPVDWLGYLIAGILIVGFSIFMWWGFFRE